MNKQQRRATRQAAKAVQVTPEQPSGVLVESEPLIGKELAAKILLVQKAVTNIPKNGYNDTHKYKYVLASDAVEHVSLALNEANLVLIPLEIVNLDCTMKIGRDTPLTRIKIRYQLLDPDTGQFFNIEWIGDGADSFDKGLNKAYTVCFKYFIMQFFMVAGEGLDPENPAYDAATPDQKPARGRGRQRGQTSTQEPAKSGAQASDTKMKYITDLMKSEWLPGPVRSAIAGWLEKNKGKCSDSGATKTIEQLKKFWPVGSTKGATKKQTGLLENLVKSDGVPKSLMEKVIEEITNYQTVPEAVVTVAQASAMIECCQWYIDKRQADKTAAPQSEDEAKADKDTGDEVDQIQSYLERIDIQVAKRTPPNDSMLKAFQEWRDDSSWTLAQCKAMLDDVRDWPMKEVKS